MAALQVTKGIPDSFVRFYRGAFYLCAIVELQRYYYFEREENKMEADEKEFYSSVHRLASYDSKD